MSASIRLNKRPKVEIKDAPAKMRAKAQLRGAVQGVGFRPFVYRLAKELDLAGWVNNSPQGVSVEVEGPRKKLDEFLSRLRTDIPPRSYIQSFESRFLDPVGYETFEIRLSEEYGGKSAVVLPDIAVCDDCAREILDRNDRRYLYPFTNCTNCGPRYTIIEALPYDRPNTSMKKFKMCAECEAEYQNPEDRRFHAQPNACPECGPSLELWDATGKVLHRGRKALKHVARALSYGKIVAVKGLGGFHLMVDARSDEAVRTLRHRKHREEKPLAIMVRGVKSVKRICEVSKKELEILKSPESPIVILRKKPGAEEISELVAPANPNLGVMFPYTPLHLLLLRKCRIPLVATSGNLTDEPISFDEADALRRLEGIADLFLVHDRPIVRHLDDSIVRVMADRETVLRRARGFAPLPVVSDGELPEMIAVGAHMKSSVAASAEGMGAVVSQHIGDLDTLLAREAFTDTLSGLEDLYEIDPKIVACDAHPDYYSTEYAVSLGVPVRPIQHHYAHLLSCIAENELSGNVLGAAWDGTGYGTDGTIWGGEILAVTDTGFTRFAHLRQFKLPGGDRAVREPRRTALGVLFELFGESAFDRAELETIKAFSSEELNMVGAMLKRGINSPVTSSAGRLFDAVASIIGVRQFIRFEGQAAMELEFLTDGVFTDDAYAHGVPEKAEKLPLSLDWGPMIEGVARDYAAGAPFSLISVRFHNTLAEMIVAAAKLSGEERVALSGGCFQNKYLLERTVDRLEKEGFRAYRHQRIPPNDGGIALGQIFGAARMLRESESNEDAEEQYVSCGTGKD